MNVIRAGVLVALSAVSANTFADWSFFAGVNQNTIDKTVTRSASLESVDDEAGGYELGLSYQLFDIVGLEAGYTSFGSFDFDSLDCPQACIPEPIRSELDVTAWNVGVNARIPLGAFALRASANRYLFDEDDSELLLEDDEWVFRAGLDYEFTDNLALGVGYKSGDVIESGYDARVTFSF